MRRMRIVLFGVIAVMGFGCGKGASAPDCKSAVAKAMAATSSQDQEMTAKVVQACEDDKWPADVRTCLAAAKTDEDIEPCLKTVPEPAYVKAARDAEERARILAEQAAAEAQRAADEVERMGQQMRVRGAEEEEAVKAVEAAQTQSERDAAKAKLEELRRGKAEMEKKLGELKAEAARAERMKGVKISKECLDNPLAKGC